MAKLQVTQHGDFQIATHVSRTGGFIAWGKMGHIVAEDPVREPGAHVWFEFGASRDEARTKLMDELGLK